jgi:raffinose/stachyose/melibiose transport system substrate-binding protein
METPMATKRRVGAVVALLATTTLLAAACGSGGNSSNNNSSGLYQKPVTLVWWTNYNTDGPGKTYMEKVAADFHTLHPTVTVQFNGIETNDLQRNKIPAALLSNNPPDVFQAWGGGEMAEQVQSGYLMDITDQTKQEVANIGPAASIWAVNGRQYGLPYQFGIEGFWYNKDLFTKAGISSPPATMDDLNADIAKLKTAGTIPVAVGAGDKWPAGHWWYNFAVRECSASALSDAASKHSFDDPCFIKAGQDLQAFDATNPFQPNFLATPGQQGANSSAGLVANGKAAMELMGAWDGGTMGSLTPDGKEPSFLGWFPFPSVPGAGGSQTTMMGGGDGYACSKKAPAECVEFLKYLVSQPVLTGYAGTGAGIPTTKGSESGLTDPVLQTVSKATQSAGGVELWLDTQFGATAGTAMNDAIVAIMAGKGTPQGVVDALKKATQQ